MIGPTPTRLRPLRKTAQFYTPACQARDTQPATVLVTRCSVCGAGPVSYGYPRNHFYCRDHKGVGDAFLA